MHEVNIHETNTTLTKLVGAAEAGEMVRLARAGRPVARGSASIGSEPESYGLGSIPTLWIGYWWTVDVFRHTPAPLANAGHECWVGSARAREVAIKRALSTILTDFSLAQPERAIGEAYLHVLNCRRLAITQ